MAGFQKRKGHYEKNRAKRNKKFKTRLHGEMGVYIHHCNIMEKEANDRLAQSEISAQEERDAAEREAIARDVLSRYDERV